MILEDLEDNFPKAKIAKQRVKEFVALNDLYSYVYKYDPNNKNSQAYSQYSYQEDTPYNYFEETLAPYLKDKQQKYLDLFNIKGIDLLEQGFLNSHLFQVYGIFQLAHFWGIFPKSNFSKNKQFG